MKQSASKVVYRKGEAAHGLVARELRVAEQRSTSAHLPSAQLIAEIRKGLPFRELEDLRSSLQLPIETLAPKLGLSKSTLHRRKAAGRLDPAESDRVMRFARLVGKATEVLESPANARQWLASPQVGLGGEVPLDYAETEVGAREVEDLLGRIEYGVYA